MLYSRFKTSPIMISTRVTQTRNASCTFHQGLKSSRAVSEKVFMLPSTAKPPGLDPPMLLILAGWNRAKFTSPAKPPNQKKSRLYIPDSKVHEAYMGPTWGWQDPGGPHVAPWILLSGYTRVYRIWQYTVLSIKIIESKIIREEQW